MTDHIQIGDVAPRKSHVGDGTTTAFAYPFPIFIDAELEVYVDGDPGVLETDYTISGTGESAGGTVSFVTAPADGADILLLRRHVIARTSDFQASGEFRAKVINDELDFQTAVLQQINDDLGRTIRLQRTGAPASLELPDAAVRSGRALAFDADGNITTVDVHELGGASIISTDVPSSGHATGSAGESTALSAADHRHPLPALADLGIATQSEAEAGADNTTAMTPLRTAQAITKLFEGIDPLARDMAASALAYATAANDATGIAGSIGKFWLADDFDADDLASSTNAIHDAAGGYYTNLNYGADLAAAATATASSYYGAGSEPSKSNDGNDGTGWVANGSSGQWLQIEFSEAQEIRRLKVLSGYAGQDATSFDFDVQYYDGGSWTTAANITDTSAAIESLRTYDIPASAADTRWRVKQNDSTSHYWKIQTIEMMALGTPTDMTLVPSSAALATTDPLDVIGYFLFEPIDSVSFGSDIVGKISIDGGTTKETGIWTKVGDMPVSDQELWRLEADVSGQSGASLEYEITTFNSKQIELHGCVGLIATY